MGVRLRLARPDDARAIGVLVRRLLRRHVLPGQPAKAAAALLQAMTAPAIRARLCAGYRFHLAEIDGVLVGVAGVRDGNHLFQLFVTTRHQRKGIGRALWRRALADCQRRARPARITVNASAFCVPAYLRMGFVPLGAPRAHTDGIVTTPMAFELRAARGAAPASAAR